MKKKVLLSLDPEVVDLLDKESKELGINKSAYITRLLKDNTENRLSKHIVRDVENLLLYLILQNNELKTLNKDELLNKLDFIYKQSKTIQTSKSILLKEERQKRKIELKNFWNNILKMLEPANFLNNVSSNGKTIDTKKAIKFIKNLSQVIKENKKLWEK